MLQVWTEFFSSPNPEKSEGTTGGITDDLLLDFGDMKMVEGEAFSTQTNAPPLGRPHVIKRWVEQNGRTFLIEQLPYNAVSNAVQNLPPHASITKPGAGRIKATASLLPLRPRPSSVAPTSPAQPMRIAKAGPSRAGFEIDYSLVSGTVTNFVFQGNTTYCVSNVVWMVGSNVFEPGTVVKFSNTLPVYGLSLADVTGGSFGFNGNSYAPTVFTDCNDNSVGDPINGSTGMPSLGSCYFVCMFASPPVATISHARFSYAAVAITEDVPETTVTLRHCQFVSCNVGMYFGDGYNGATVTNELNLQNILAANLGCMVLGSVFSVNGENITADNTSIFAAPYGVGYPGTFYTGAVTNSIFTAVAGGTNFSYFDHSVWASSGSGIYQPVGAGGYYLTNGSPYQGAGTTNIDAQTLADLQSMTTYPPTLISNVFFTSNTNLVPQVTRDTNWVMSGGGPDLGYHYDAIDYEISSLVINNGTMTILPGTVIATVPTNGIVVQESGGLACLGTAAQPNWIVGYNVVQEEPLLGDYCLVQALEWGTNSVSFAFVNWSVASGSSFVALGYDWLSPPCVAQFENCQFYSGLVFSANAGLAFTNCLFHRVNTFFSFENYDVNGAGIPFGFCNNLFLGGYLTTDSGGTWTFVDNLFDQTIIANYAETIVCSNNAYVTIYDGMLMPTNNSVILSNSPAYEVGALGNYYYPTNLTNLIYAGSQSAVAAGLNYYTVTTNNALDGTNMVSIGFHYVATDVDGVPLNTDGNGLPDYPLDLNVADTLNPFAIYNQGASIFGWTPQNFRLGYWNFGTTNVSVAAMTSNNVFLTNAWSGQAFVITNNSSTNYSQLVYPANTNGSNFFNPGNGTIRFWFQPNWNTIDSSEPTSAFTFLSTQESSSSGDDYWSFGIQNAVDGTGVSLITVGSSTNSREYYQEYSFKSGAYNGVPVTFQSNLWYQMVLTYSPTNMALYTNGVLLATACWPQCSNGVYMYNVGLGNVFYPPASGLNNGFSIGSFQYGDQPVMGQLADLETFNYPLTAQEIAAGFPYFGGNTNNMTDTYYTGRSDMLQTNVDGFAAPAATNFTPCRLGYWRFDSPLLYAEQGQIPLSVDNVALMPSWSGTALVINSDPASQITYPDVGSNGWANINCRHGTLRFWFKPNADGPSGNAPFVYLGTPNGSDEWSLRLYYGAIQFVTASNGGGTNTILNYMTNFPSTTWMQIALTYGSTNSGSTNTILYINGVPVQTNTSFVYWPTLSNRQLGMVIGNTTAYNSSINGQFEEIETFNYQLSASEILSNFQVVANVDSDLDGVPDLLEDTLTTARPFLGAPVVITGTIEAEQFDLGTNGVAYSTTASNPTNGYRKTGLFITNCDDLGGGYCLDQTVSNDWAQYSINVLVPQAYTIETRVEGLGTNGAFQITFSTNGTVYATNGPLAITNTGWINLSRVVSLSAGTNVMKLQCMTNANTNGIFGPTVARFNYISVYPYWTPPTNGTSYDDSWTNNLVTSSDFYSASNNAFWIQYAVDALPTNGGIVHVPPGIWNVSQAYPNDAYDAYLNAVACITNNNVAIVGSAAMNTTLVANNRSTTLFCVGQDPISTHRCTNFILRDITLEAQPHEVAFYNSLLGYTNLYELGQLIQSGATGAITVFNGMTSSAFTSDILISNCVFVHGDRSIQFNFYISNSLITACQFLPWDATNFFTGAVNQSPSNTSHTAGNGGSRVGIFSTAGTNYNLNVTGNTYIGNSALTSVSTTNYAPDGFFWIQAGGNVFLANNTISNNYYEGVQLNAGPNAVVGNTYGTLVRDGSCCALNAFQNNYPGATGYDSINYSTCFVGNSVYGDSCGEYGVANGQPALPYTINFSGNYLTLPSSFDEGGPSPGAAVSAQYCQSANICGNTLISGGYGLVYTLTNNTTLVLKNNFSNAACRGIGYGTSADSLNSAQIFGNLLGEGVSFHVQLPYSNSFSWFLDRNTFLDTNFNVVPPFIDPISSSIHIGN